MIRTTATINLDTIKARCTIDADGCWIWTRGTINGRPYWASCDTNKKRVNVHVMRAVASLIGVKIEPKKQATSICGKPLCVNPDCLRRPTAYGMFSQLVKSERRAYA